MVAKVSPYDFFVAAWPLALAASKACGVLPEIIWAQAANETLYGLHAPQNNYFGIKGPGADLMTTEVIHGVTVHEKQHFAGYADMPSSFAGYAAFIASNERYSAFRRGPNLVAQLGALSRSGYATDPEYTMKIVKIAITSRALLARYNSIVGKVSRALSPKPIPVIVAAPVVATPVLKQDISPMSKLSVFLNAHAASLTEIGSVLESVAGVVLPAPVSDAIKAATAAIGTLSTQVSAAATAVQTVETTAAAQSPAVTLDGEIKVIETDAMAAAIDAGESALADLVAGKPLATIETDAVQAAETGFKGTSN